MPQKSGIHTVTKLFIDEESLVFFLLVALEAGTSLLTEEAVYDATTVAGGAFRPGNEVAPAVFTPGNALFSLAEGKGQLLKGKAENAANRECTLPLRDAVQQCRVAKLSRIGVDGEQLLDPLLLAGPLHAVEGHLKDVPQIGWTTGRTMSVFIGYSIRWCIAAWMVDSSSSVSEEHVVE